MHYSVTSIEFRCVLLLITAYKWIPHNKQQQLAPNVHTGASVWYVERIRIAFTDASRMGDIFLRIISKLEISG